MLVKLWVLLSFFTLVEVIHVLLTIVVMYYIFLISFSITKVFNFQISYSLKGIIMKIKAYQIIIIDTSIWSCVYDALA